MYLHTAYLIDTSVIVVFRSLKHLFSHKTLSFITGTTQRRSLSSHIKNQPSRGWDSQQQLSHLVTNQDIAKQWSLIPNEYLLVVVYSKPNH